MGISLGAIVVTGVALLVGLGGALLAWRLVGRLPSDDAAPTPGAEAEDEEEPSAGGARGAPLARKEPSAGEREGAPLARKEPSAGEREGAPLARKESAQESE